MNHGGRKALNPNNLGRFSGMSQTGPHKHRRDTMNEKTISMPEFANALLATQQPGYIAENLNEACNRRAVLAIATVIAAIESRIYAVRMNDALTTEDHRAIENMRDIIDDIQTIKKGFGHGA